MLFYGPSDDPNMQVFQAILLAGLTDDISMAITGIPEDSVTLAEDASLYASEDGTIFSTEYMQEQGLTTEQMQVLIKDSNDPTNLQHVFGKTQHDLDQLLNAYKGDQTTAYQSIQMEAQTYVNQNGITGVIDSSNEFTIKAGGYNVTVHGNVMDGVFRLGTAFVKSN